jgi:translation initiation factor 2 alpha subunit (eIF-2alpha)
MIDMLKILSVTLNQTSSIISENQDQYPFLKEMIGDSTNQSSKSVDAMINIGSTDISNATSVKDALVEIHNNLESPADMIEVANKTIGDPDNTTPIIKDMYNTVSNMTDVNNTTSNATYGYANW